MGKSICDTYADISDDLHLDVQSFKTIYSENKLLHVIYPSICSWNI